MLVSGRPFPASPAAGEAEAGPRRDDDKLAGGCHGYLRSVLSVQAEQAGARWDLRGHPLFP